MKKGWLDKYTEIADGGTTISGPTILSRQDPAYKSYQDSLNLYNSGLNSISAIATIEAKPFKHLPNMRQESIDRYLHPNNWASSKYRGGVSTDKYKKNGQYGDYDPTDPTGSRGRSSPRATIDDAIKWEEETIEGYAKNAYTTSDINGLTSKDRIAKHTIALNALKKQKSLMTNGIDPTHIILPQEGAFSLIYKKPTAPPTIAKVPTLEPRGVSSHKELYLREMPKFDMPVDRTLSNTQGVYLNSNRYMVPGAKVGSQKIDFYDNGDTEWSKKKNGGEVNYNNSNVSLPEGFVGMGNDTSGRNYSPAWGGQFQNGGWASKYISEDKFLQPNSEKLPTGYKIPNRDPSSELAMSIGGEDGEPAYLIPSFKYGQPLEDPLKEYRETGDYLGGPFKTWQEADDWDINVRHPYVEKNQAIPFPIRTKGKDMQMGGVLPSAFVRTGDIPSEGKYAKKTIPSAQTGLISHPGGNRNINTNQVTISPRQEYENIQAEKKKQSELFNYIQKNNEIQKARSDIYTDPQTGKQVIQNIGIKPSASPIDAAVLGVGALYSGGMGLLGSMANMLSPVPLPSKNILSNIYKRFPLTNNAKIKLIEEQDKAFQTANAFTEAWATHPVTKEKINNILNTRKGNYIQYDLDTPFYNYNNVLVDTKNYNPYDFPGDVADLLNKGERKFAGFNDPRGYSVTLRNGIIGKVPAKKIGETAVHEGGHTMQHMGGDPANYYHGGWNNEITAYNPKTNYYSANLDTDLGRYFGKNIKTPNKFHRWEASPDELHADLMTARFKANITPDTELTDKVVDNLIKQGNLNKFFKYGVSKNIKRDMIRMLPVVTGVALLKNKPQDESSYASGGQIKTDNRGYWNPKNWGHPVRINSNDITMEGVDQPLWGISDTGDTKYMEPGQDYRFKGKSVTEYPMARNGINNLDEKTTEHLDQLTNFTNYNKPTVGGWLNKYS